VDAGEITSSATRSAKNAARDVQARAGESAPSPPAAATIWGDGVSPAASSAASGSPPGSPSSTCAADRGRNDGSDSRQRRMIRSTTGSRSEACRLREVGGVSERTRFHPARVSASCGCFPVNSS
jgi:hypothetical protein